MNGGRNSTKWNDVKTKKEIEARLAELAAQMVALSKEVSTLNQELVILVSPFSVGDIIVWQGRQGRIISIFSWNDGAAFVVRPILPDGTERQSCTVLPYHHPKLYKP